MTSSISNRLLYEDSLFNESIHSSSSDQNDFVGLLLADFSAVLSRENEPLTENREYMQLTELKFLLKNIRELTAIQLFQSYSRSETVTCTESAESSYSTLRISSAKKSKGSAGRVTGNTDENIEEFRAVGNPSNTKESEESIKSSGVKRASTDRLLLFNNRGKLDAILCDLKKYVSKRLAIAEEHFNSENVRTNMQMDGEEDHSDSRRAVLVLPRILELCNRYKLSESEREMFHLMVVVQGSSDSHVLNILVEEDYLRRISGFQRLSGMSEVGIELFCDPERHHIKEGMVMVEEENGAHFNLRTPRTVVQILYGYPVRSDDLLKVSQTVLEEILIAEASAPDLSVPLMPSPFHSARLSTSRRADSHGGGGGGGAEGLSGASPPLSFSPSGHLMHGGVLRPHSSNSNSGSGGGGGAHVTTLLQNNLTDPSKINMNGDKEKEKMVNNADRAEGNTKKRKTPSDPTPTPTSRQRGRVRGKGNGAEKKKMKGVVVFKIAKGFARDDENEIESDDEDSDDDDQEDGEWESGTGSEEEDEERDEDRDDRLSSKRSAGVKAAGVMQPIDTNTNANSNLKTATQHLAHTSSSSNINNIISNNSSVSVNGSVSSCDLPYGSAGDREGTQLEYLEDSFQLIALMVRGNAARIKDDMKKEGTRMNNWDGGGDVKHGRRELQAKLKLNEARVQRRVAATKRLGLPLPRLEVLAERFQLDSFEKKMICLLIGKTVSSVVRTLVETLENSGRSEDSTSVGQALNILCQDFHSQVGHRKYFYRSGKLMTHGIISLSKNRWHQGSGDLTDNKIILDRRVLDWVVGLDSEINELVEGSDLYEPKVNLSQVVLPTGHLDALLAQCTSYDLFRKYRTQAGLEEVLAYGNSLVIMLCGKSGTGKTMTVNAIAKELGKKVLLVDFGSLTGRKSDGGDMDADLRGLFREAQMNNAVLFFDECEVVFRTRNQGGDRLLNSLLTEIERHEGIVFLATNRPHDLDEAMHRRITAVLEYRPPDHVMRREIWSNLLYGSGKKSSSTSSPSSSSACTKPEKIEAVIGDSVAMDRIADAEGANTNIESAVNTDVRAMTDVTVSTATIVTAAASAFIDESNLNGTIKSTSTSTGESDDGDENADSGKSDRSANGDSHVSTVIDVDSNSNTDTNSNSNSSSGSGSGKEKRNSSSPSSSLSHGSLQLSDDVDVAALSAKYELTGGFIKNAVLSALLSAISRCKLEQTPVLTQDDLIRGCKLQMRGSLNQRVFEDKLTPHCGLEDLALSPNLKDPAESIIRFEKSRSKVYGSWASVSNSFSTSTLTSKRGSGGGGAVNGVDLRTGSRCIAQKATICCLAGPTGSGKKTLMQAIAYDLGRAVKMVHVADLMTGSTSETVAHLQAIVQDARLADAMVTIDGFEHVLDDSSAGGEAGWKLHLLLSRMLEVLHRFPGCVVLIVHVDQPQNITLQRDFAVKLFSFVRFTTPPHAARAKLWAALMPRGAPLCKHTSSSSQDGGEEDLRSEKEKEKEKEDIKAFAVNYTELGRRFEINPGSIQSAIARACAEAAMRDYNSAANNGIRNGINGVGVGVRQRDLIAAGEAEVAKLKGGNFELISKLFT